MKTEKRQKRNDVAFAVASEKFGVDFVKSALGKNFTNERLLKSGMRTGCGCGCGGDSFEPLTEAQEEVINIFRNVKVVP